MATLIASEMLDAFADDRFQSLTNKRTYWEVRFALEAGHQSQTIGDKTLDKLIDRFVTILTEADDAPMSDEDRAAQDAGDVVQDGPAA